MKVSISQGGTIVPVLTTTDIDSEALAPDDAEVLRGLVERAGIGAGKPTPSGPARPDRGSYRITLHDGDRRESVILPDADLPPQTQELIDWVSGHPRATRRVEPLGG